MERKPVLFQCKTTIFFKIKKLSNTGSKTSSLTMPALKRTEEKWTETTVVSWKTWWPVTHSSGQYFYLLELFVQINFVLIHRYLIKFLSNVFNLFAYLHTEYLTYILPENVCYSKTGSGGKKMNYSTSSSQSLSLTKYSFPTKNKHRETKHSNKCIKTRFNQISSSCPSAAAIVVRMS